MNGYASELLGLFSGRLGRHFSGGQNAPHDRGIELVFPLAHAACVVLDSQDEDRQSALFVEIFLRDRSQGSAPFRPCSRYAVSYRCFRTFQVKTRTWSKSKSGRRAARSEAEILGTFLIPILNLVEHEKRDESLAFGVLRNFERDIHVDHAR